MKESISVSKKNTGKMTTVALLTAIGIIIPMISPIKIAFGPFSWTLGSHIAIDMALFISPASAAFVALATSFGFLMAGFPLPVVFRAVSHLLFTLVGAYTLQRSNQFVLNPWKRTLFNAGINSLHGLGEMIVIHCFVTAGLTSLDGQYGYWASLFILFGVSSLFHGMMDFELGYLFLKYLNKHLPYKFPRFPIK
ncbi:MULTISPECIES: hypothetical protein [Aerococcus]|uniref:Uncharacterized protein n=2 Tax=Aerococcus TaxID=1375 RepID=A0A178HFE8_9LACT|nr:MULTISPECIES: hypothetical protein [Aerococcus]AEA00616.1 hypothetical protein HMPREF9243_0065 [Aerococcus sp. Group 1]KAA9218771.1 hypothetical protein F6I39_06080 [Aerococcus loyolae]KAA9265291.1 hypothetical protein F6I19_04950 [Aerococcus loyolae]MCY3026006.1 hypothetical protein [Aerococcus loyolae]MCY3027933.1 hypothetical protein [Aerococcus loyolae]